MLTELCQELRNWFDKERHFGTFVIENGSIDLSEAGIQNGQYFRIVGSVFNDGVHQYPAADLTDETFDGAVWAMAVPQAVITLNQDIMAWQRKYGTADSEAMSPFTSESFGGYSYSKGSGSSGSGAGGVSWKSACASRLSLWRRIRP